MAKQLNLSPPASFNLNDENRHTADTRWPAWCKELDTYLLASGVTDKPQKKAVLLYVSGPPVNEIYSTLQPEDSDDYETVKKKITDHFAPFKNLDYEVFAFSQMRQIDGEQLDEFVVRLRVAAIRCEFGTATDAELKRQIIRGCSSSKLRQHIILPRDACDHAYRKPSL